MGPFRLHQDAPKADAGYRVAAQRPLRLSGLNHEPRTIHRKIALCWERYEASYPPLKLQTE